jgi:hypothetical protein
MTCAQRATEKVRLFSATASRVFLIVMLCLSVAALFGQTPTGAIEGTVTDPSGAVVPNAKVVITEKATDRAITIATNAEGIYSMRNLLPGVYNVRVEAPGFSAKELRDVSVNSGSAVNGSVALEIGKVGDVVEIAAQAVAVDTLRQTVDSVVTEKEIKELPLFSRNFLDLAVLAPGVFVRDGASIDPTKTFAYRAVGVDGKSGTGTRVQMDGIDVTDETVGTTVANVSQEAVQQFQLTRSSLDISTSLTSSGAVNIITNSGSNALHGSWFYDYFNQDMGARLAYQPTAAAFDRKRSGFSVGGPFKKDKLFWFLNGEETWQNTNSISTIPQFPQFNVVQPFPTKVKYALGRLDWNVSQNMRVFYKFNHDDNVSTGGGALSPFQNVDYTNVHTAGLDYNMSHATNSFRFGYTNFNNAIASQELDTKFLRSNGTAIQLNVGPVGWGPNGLAPQATYQDNWQFSYDGSYLWNKHTFRYGMSFTHVRLGGFANFAGPLAVNGTYDAGTIASLQAAGANIQDPTVYPLSSFSLGPQNGFFTLAGCDNLAHGCHTNNRTAFFVGDNIKVTRRLALNLGLRFEYDSGYFNNEGVARDPILESWGKGYSQTPQPPKFWNPSLGFAWDPKGDGKTSIRGGVYRAYEMNIFNNLIFDEFMMLPPGIGPDSYDNTFVSAPDGTPINIDGKHPAGDYSDLVGQPINKVLPVITQVNAALQAAYNNYKFDPKVGKPDLEILLHDFDGIFPGNQFKAPYAVQFNIGVQRQIRSDTVLSIDYIYNHGVGGPFLLNDMERRHDAGTLSTAAAQTKVNGILGGSTVDQYIASHPTATISTFGLSGDAIYTGLTPTYQYMRFMGGGYSKYSALQVNLRGRLRGAKLVRDTTYNISYSRGSSEATNASSRTEFLATPLDNHNPTNPLAFGPTGLDYRHILGAGVTTRIPGGLVLNSLWSFRTPAAQNITIPNILSATSSSNGIFSTDLNGDGGTGSGSPRGDVFPTIGAGQFGRDIDSLDKLNQAINAFNQQYAGKLTPAGQALVNAGIFTQAQLVSLKAVVPTIPLVPTGNPNPWHNIFTTDLRITRPVTIKEKWKISPFADVINLFNHAPMAEYSGLGTTFGSLNFNYTANTPGQGPSDLAFRQGRVSSTRQVQVGVRLDF